MQKERRMRLFSRRNKIPASEPTVVKRLMSYQVANLQGIGARESQEDSFAFVNAMDVTRIRDNGLFAVLADGMGGMLDGKKVSEAAVAVLLEEFDRMDRQQDLGRQLRESVYRADSQLYGWFGGSGGTTLTACIFFEEKLYFASVGDSFLYLKRGNGIYRLNREQTYRQTLYLRQIEEGRLTPEYADRDPDAARLSEFLGSGSLGEIDGFQQPWTLHNGDLLLLCSDGIGGILTERELFGCLEEPAPEQACKRMEQEIQKRGCVYQDNYTALVISCKY